MRGAVALENAWLKKDSLKDVAVYVVWSPQLGAKESNVASATALVPDARAAHYWDGKMLIGSACPHAQRRSLGITCHRIARCELRASLGAFDHLSLSA